ncbi:Predicted acetyltransferase, GNAT family [Burkholderia sp. YR290]|nr:Predicted acetyltransferase, GNAT family [Burkholderia sp. YR290]
MSVIATNRNEHHTHPLDELTWNALTGRQRRFMVGNDRVVRFQSDVAPFAAMADNSPASFSALREVIKEHGAVALPTVDAVERPAGFAVLRHAMLTQMVCERAPAHAKLEHVRLGSDDVPEMLALTAATQPGPFGPRTIELGDYLGIRKDGVLVAMAGERMKIDGYTEISAVCVDPAFRGQGLASTLMTLLIAAIRARGETPFLHVLTSNFSAISVYQGLGFVQRRAMHLTVLEEEKI